MKRHRVVECLSVLLLICFSQLGRAAALAVPGPYGRSLDVTAKTGERIEGKLVSWQTPNGTANVEHLAGRSPDGQLLVFYWSPQADWRVVNVSKKTGYLVSHPLVAWQTPSGHRNVEHLAGVSPDSHLITYWWSPAADWQAVDITAKTGVAVTGEVTAWQTRSGSHLVEHLAARSPSGDLIVFWWSPVADWQSVNVSQKTGVRIRGAVDSWQTRDGTNTIEHLAAIAEDGMPVEFTWRSGQDWRSDKIRRSDAPMKDALSFWFAGSTEHLAGPDINGHLIVYWRSPRQGWSWVDVTAMVGETIESRPSPYQIKDSAATIEVLGARAPSGELLYFWYSNALDWQVYSMSEVADRQIETPPVGWVTPGTSGVEHFAASTRGKRLTVFLDGAKPRRLTDDLQRPHQTLERQRGVRNTLTILWTPENPGVLNPGRFDVQNATDVMEEVDRYYRENSGNQLGINNVETLGWFASQKSADHYWLPHSNNEQNDGWRNGDVEKWAEAIRQADATFDFASYDSDGSGTLEADELAVVIMIPRAAGHWGFNRGVDGLQIPMVEPLEVDNVIIPGIVEIYVCCNRPNRGLVAHELAHRLFDHEDLYFDRYFNSYAAGVHAIMAGDQTGGHHDPFTKIKFGWAKPRLVLRPGRYAVRGVEASRTVRVLLHPDRYADEFLILENRDRGVSFDSVLPGDGMAVWHIIQDPALYGSIMAPPNTPLTCTPPEVCWSSLPADEWMRRGVRLIRPIVTPPYQDAESLWSGAVPARSYRLTSTDTNPAHATLRWADGTPGTWSLSNFSNPGAVMEVSIER